MREFFNWWNTNANSDQYMTMLQCAMDDLPVIAMVNLFCFGIVIQYGDVALHNYRVSRKYPASNTKKYLLLFTAVFVFCLFSGYGYRILSTWTNPYKLLALMLLILNVMTFFFRKYMKQTKAVENLYESEKWAMEKLASIHNELEQKLSKDFGSSESIQSISMEDLKGLTVGKWYKVEGVDAFYSPLDLKGDKIKFRTIIFPHQYFGWHEHPCWEACYVNEGALLDVQGGKKYGVGEWLMFEPNVQHNPGAEIYTDIDVYFSEKRLEL